MGSLRTPEGKKIYNEYLASADLSNCPLCGKEPMKSFQFWKVTDNSFPYDLIARTHHMLVPLRHASEKELTQAEWQELRTIRDTFIHPEYEWVIEATHPHKSVPSHYHLHLLVGK